METSNTIPAVIKLLMVLIFIDSAATMTFFYFDAMYDPEIELFDIENLVSFIFPLFYFAGMVWLIRARLPITKIILYVVFALEFAAFMIDIEAASFDIFSMLSLVSIAALLGSIYILHADAGKKWFVVKK